MCMRIDTSVTSLNKRTVWKVFDKQPEGIVSLFMATKYPKGKQVQRSAGPAHFVADTDGSARSSHGLYFFTSKALATRMAERWPDSYIARFAVSSEDFMFTNKDLTEAVYARATRVGNYIRVR
jgi:hypothetical protein